MNISEAKTFIPAAPLACPDCGSLCMKFYDHCLVGWLCAPCYERVQSACQTLAGYKSVAPEVAAVLAQAIPSSQPFHNEVAK